MTDPASSSMRAAGGARLLFLQHAGALGGSAYSLLYTMQGLKSAGFAPEVALAKTAVGLRQFYQDAGFTVHLAPDIDIFAHTTGGYARVGSPISLANFGRQWRHWVRSRRATLELVARVKPDIVHLNSVVLLPSAEALREAGIPHVWHVRECPPMQDWRTQLIRRELLRHSHVVFLSEFDRRQWTGTDTHGVIVPNFVNLARFDGSRDRVLARRQLGFAAATTLILYVGGTPKIKGFSVLIEAIPMVHARFPDAVFAMPGAEIRPSQRLSARFARAILPRVGWGTPGQRVMKRIEQLGVGRVVRMLPFAEDIVPWLAACDFLVFPSTAPHFARPIVEAAAMRRPAIGSRIGGVKELIEPERTGLLVAPNRPAELGAAMLRMLAEPELVSRLGAAAEHRARVHYGAERGVAALAGLYHMILGTVR